VGRKREAAEPQRGERPHDDFWTRCWQLPISIVCILEVRRRETRTQLAHLPLLSPRWGLLVSRF
jgi:hypothetical protein